MLKDDFLLVKKNATFYKNTHTHTHTHAHTHTHTRSPNVNYQNIHIQNAFEYG